MLTSSYVYSQSEIPPSSLMNTSFGSTLHFSCYKYDDGYNVSISLWEKFLGEVSSLTADFAPSEIEKFKVDLKLVRLKFLEWAETAKRNNVRDVQKDIPVKISSIIKGSGTRVASSTNATIKAIFRVSNYQPMCIIKESVSYYNQHQEGEWLLSSSDIERLIQEIDNIRTKWRNWETTKKRTEDLFK